MKNDAGKIIVIPPSIELPQYPEYDLYEPLPNHAPVVPRADSLANKQTPYVENNKPKLDTKNNQCQKFKCLTIIIILIILIIVATSIITTLILLGKF